MFKLGITGYPLGHSLSPIMHNAALLYLKLKGDYSKLETEPQNLEARIKQLKKENYSGINVTIPYKVDVIKYLDHIDKFATIVGAVNTIKITEDGLLHGYNTDIYGFTEAFNEDQKLFLQNKTAVILGAGGAARAIAIGLIELGISKLVFCVRNIEKAQSLINELNEKFIDSNIVLKELHEDIDISFASLVVNTTPLGMQGKYENISPISKKSVKTLPKDAIVYDIVYKPQKTKLLEYSTDASLTIIGGIDMLILQGAKAFEIWTGQVAPVEIMKQAVISNL